MSMLKIISAVVLSLGLVVLIVLVTLGGVIKHTISTSVYSRLEYKMPDGYKSNPNYEECYRSTSAKFVDEYYMWNLTNPNEFLSGSTPMFNLTGPFAYTQWYCNYDHNINKETGFLTYRTYIDGYMFLRDDSVSNDDVPITNINPAYLGILKQTDDSALPLLFSGAAIQGIIETLQDESTLTLLWEASTPNVLNATNNAIINSVTLQTAAGFIGSMGEENFFDPSFSANGVEGWAYYAISLDASANVTVSGNAQDQIFLALSNVTLLVVFEGKSGSDIAALYGVTEDQGDSLANYVDFMLSSNLAVAAATTSTVYGAWANSTTTGAFPSGWQASITGQPTGISANDVAALFNSAGPCALTSPTGIQAWIAVVNTGADLNTLCPGVFSLDPTQVQLLANWFYNYATTVVNPTLLSSFQLTDWNDFAYAQWGNLVSGTSVASVTGLDYDPEYGAIKTCSKFSTADAKTLLNGTHGLFNSTNMQTLLLYLQVSDLGSVQKLWPMLTIFTAPCFYNYLSQVVVPYIALPNLQLLFAEGGGLVTTRTVREWLFDAQDPLLALVLGPDNADVSLVGNLTRSKAVADTMNFTYVRIYTGHNDLHWSLMPVNEGTNLTFWNGTELITGYNGTQFLPNGYLDEEVKPYPLTLFHHLINRTIPFKNKGADMWEDVHVRYLTLADDALSSEFLNPHNYLYYSLYSGCVNKSSNPPGLPVFLTTPDFLSAEPAFSENVSWTDQVFTDYDPNDQFSTHRLALFILAEPTLGSSLWGNLPIQINLQFQPTGLFPNITSGFAPIYWNAIGDKATEKDLHDVKSSLYAAQTAWKVLIGVGVGVGVVMIAAGIIGLVYDRKLKGEKIPTGSVE